MHKRSTEVWFHVACFVVTCILVLVVQPLFLKHFGVNQIVIEEAVAAGILAIIMSIACFIYSIITDVKEKKRGY